MTYEETRVTRGYEALNRGDVDGVVALMDERIVYRMPMDPAGEFPIFEGHDGVRRFMGLLQEGFAEIEAEVRAIYTVGKAVLAQGRMRLTAHSGQALDFPFSHFWVLENGRAVRVAFHDAANPLVLLEEQAALSPERA